MRHVISIDQGTTGTTVLVLDEALQVRGRGYQEFRQIYPEPGWVEHDPEDIWASVCAALRGALQGIDLTSGPASDPASIAAIGITNQRETTVVWDRRTGRPIHHAIVWQDRRTADALRRARRGRQGPAGPRADRPHPRPVLLGDQARVAARPRPRGRRRGERRRARVRHDRHLPRVAADRRRGPRHRRHATRRARCCSTSTTLAWSDEMLRADRRAARDPARAWSPSSGTVGLTRGVPGAPRRHPDRRARRRSAGGAVRPGVLHAGRREVHLRHRRVHPDEHRRAPDRRRRAACSPPWPGSSRPASCATRSRARRSSPAPPCSGCATASGSSRRPPTSRRWPRRCPTPAA